jgi:hypothetical protein
MKLRQILKSRLSVCVILLISGLALCLGSPGPASAESHHQNLFASIYLKDDKIGHIHLTFTRNEDGELETLNAKASVSFLGLKVYQFNQRHHETWKNGELVEMTGYADDNGEVHEVSLVRTAEEYKVDYNGQTKMLPHGAFPTAPWHYKITESTLLFNILNFDLFKVKVGHNPDTVTIGKSSIPATLFKFTGDWKAKLWFDESKSFLEAEYDIAGRRVRVVTDP